MRSKQGRLPWEVSQLGMAGKWCRGIESTGRKIMWRREEKTSIGTLIASVKWK